MGVHNNMASLLDINAYMVNLFVSARIQCFNSSLGLKLFVILSGIFVEVSFTFEDRKQFRIVFDYIPSQLETTACLCSGFGSWFLFNNSDVRLSA